MNKIILIGGGGFSSEVAEVASQNDFKVLGYIDKKKTKSNLTYLGNEDEYLTKHDPDHFIFPAFAAVDRKGVHSRAKNIEKFKKYKIPALISKHSHISDSVKIGRGTFIGHGVIINPQTDLDEFVIVNCRSTIGHDVNISSNTIISGHVFIGGSSKIGQNCLIGPGANLMQSSEIGNNVVISIGSNIARRISDGKTTLPRLAKNI